jgi:hypothetical protein
MQHVLFLPFCITKAQSSNTMNELSIAMESAGKSMMERKSPVEVGNALALVAMAMDSLSQQILAYAPTAITSQTIVLEDESKQNSSQRMAFAASKMSEAASILRQTSPSENTNPNVNRTKRWIQGP